MNTSTIITPIAAKTKKNNNKPCSLSDYNEQIERGRGGMQLMWDDAKGNPTKKVGGLFGFVHNLRRVEIHFVTKILPSTSRLDSWSNNVGQRDRNVLYLSHMITSIPWNVWRDELQITTWIELGTRRVANENKNNSIYNHVNHAYDVETGEIFVPKKVKLSSTQLSSTAVAVVPVTYDL